MSKQSFIDFQSIWVVIQYWRISKYSKSTVNRLVESQKRQIMISILCSSNDETQNVLSDPVFALNWPKSVFRLSPRCHMNRIHIFITNSRTALDSII